MSEVVIDKGKKGKIDKNVRTDNRRKKNETAGEEKNRVLCLNFGHSALTSSLAKYKFLHVKNSFATIMN